MYSSARTFLACIFPHAVIAPHAPIGLTHFGVMGVFKAGKFTGFSLGHGILLST